MSYVLCFLFFSLIQQNHVNEAQQSSGWLSNILPPAPTSLKIAESNESSNNNTPVHSTLMSPLKPVNLLPDVPINPSARKLTDKEQKDCDVIGMLTIECLPIGIK